MRQGGLVKVAALLASALLMQACTGAMDPTPTRAASGGCQAPPAEPYLGRRPTAELVDQLRLQAQATTARVIAHDEMVTKEFRVGRLNIHLAPDGTIARFTCG